MVVKLVPFYKPLSHVRGDLIEPTGHRLKTDFNLEPPEVRPQRSREMYVLFAYARLGPHVGCASTPWQSFLM